MRGACWSALIAALLLSLVASTAAARTGLTASRNHLVAYFPQLELESAGVGVIRCRMTLDITLHASIAKTEGALAGYARLAVSTGACERPESNDVGLLVGGSRVTGLQGPFHVQFVSFEGTLPEIRTVTLRIIGVTFWLKIGSTTCLTRGAQNIEFITGGAIRTASEIRIRATRIPVEGGLCGLVSTTMRATSPLLYASLAEAPGGTSVSTTIELI